MLYATAVSLHVVVAILVIGLVGAVPLAARVMRHAGGQVSGIEQLLRTVLRATQLGFLAMLVTGVLLDVAVSGSFHRTGWLKASVAMLLVVGVAHARARSALRKAVDVPEEARLRALRRVEGWGWVMCAAIGVITVLMQDKPFP